MKRRAIALILGTIMILSFGGCQKYEYPVGEEDLNKISEYAAVILLKHDANNRSRLVPEDIIEETERRRKAWEEAGLLGVKEDKTEQGMRPTVDTPVIDKEQAETQNDVQKPTSLKETGSLNAFFQLQEGIELKYMGYSYEDNYPEKSDELIVEANEGKKLLVIKFNISNTTSEKQFVDCFSKTALYQIIRNNNENDKIGIMKTMLTNDMSTYVGDLNAGETRELCFITEVEKEEDSVMMLKLKEDERLCMLKL